MKLSESRIVIFEGPDWLPRKSGSVVAAMFVGGMFLYGAYELGKSKGKKEEKKKSK